MSTLLLLIGCVALWLALATAKEMFLDAKTRRDDRVMAAFLEAEDARYHRYRLLAIDRAVQATNDKLDRIAAEAHDEVIEGVCREVSREVR
jgi:hypothetical protein